MTTSEKPRSKPPAKKKAVTLEDLQAQLNAIRIGVAFCVLRLGTSKGEQSHPVVKQAEKTLHGDGEGKQQ